ncbi:hypothetical protein N7495_002227 [Penicillium taxi]|uniref:uncharacterized protein n=1 Tax=Penicillium taxi TaxID=168475 RepID=UPI0025458E01|nr:uncharacterized protein N7495_002227 [Penicillium taxi]KAJ5901699.1 hypothetical protein N7495_002227 [Penicillium taxi]
MGLGLKQLLYVFDMEGESGHYCMHVDTVVLLGPDGFAQTIIHTPFHSVIQYRLDHYGNYSGEIKL